jgi:peptidoglycan hydrolase-like protein with peptidoglycan-binding domain
MEIRIRIRLKNGSELIRAIQRYLHITADGFCGNETIIALQIFLNVTVDGYMGGETVTALQYWINNQI